MDYTNIKAIIEGLLFVSGDEGIDAKQLAQIVELDKVTVIDLIEDLKADYKRHRRGIQLIEVAGSYQLTTLQEHAPYFERLAFSPTHATLSQAALETLSIIAYRQPITRVEIEEIRGVKSERAIHTLMNKLLIKEAGRSEGTGRAILYGTTKEFLDYFGLKNIQDLPPLSDKVDVEQIEASLFQQENKTISS